MLDAFAVNGNLKNIPHGSRQQTQGVLSALQEHARLHTTTVNPDADTEPQDSQLKKEGA